ncbi:MAG: ROK family protein, partial [Myxococcota bacterium]
MHTLCVDVGGTGIKGMVVDALGQPASDHRRIDTPRPAVPEAVLAAIDALAAGLVFDRVSVGFPGVVRAGVTIT